MMQLAEVKNIDVLRGVLIETLKDVPEILEIKDRTIDGIVEKTKEHTEQLMERIIKFKREIRVSKRIDNSSMLARLLRLIKQKNTLMLALHTIVRDKYLYVNILDEF